MAVAVIMRRIILKSDETIVVQFSSTVEVEIRVWSNDLIEYEFGLAGQAHSFLHLI